MTARRLTDADLLASLTVTMHALRDADLCYRCDGPEADRIDPVEPDDGLCAGCRDEVAHNAENARQTWRWEGHDPDEATA